MFLVVARTLIRVHGKWEEGRRSKVEAQLSTKLWVRPACGARDIRAGARPVTSTPGGLLNR